MVVTCPQCKVRLKVDDAKIPPQGARFKCPKCSGVIFVKAPTVTLPQTQDQIQEQVKPVIRSEGVIKRDTLDKTKVLIAHGDREFLEEMERIIRAAGYIPITSQDGIDAIVKASKELPFVAVLDVALPKEYGFDVCKKLKEIEYTKDIKIILVASVYDKTRFKRPPASTYGADEIIEDHEVKELLVSKINDLKTTVPVTSSEAKKEEEPLKKISEKPDVTSTPRTVTSTSIPKGFDSFVPPSTVTSPPKGVETTVTSASGLKEPEAFLTQKEEITAPVTSIQTGDEMVEKARRLARTIISDIYFYNLKKFEEAIKKGTFYETFQDELKEGFKLYESRIPPEIRKKADFFKEEMDSFIENKKKSMNF